MSSLLDGLHDALGDTESFESERIKSRAVRCETYHVGADRRGFVHATVLFSPGRPEALKREVARRLLDIMRSDAELGGRHRQQRRDPAVRAGDVRHRARLVVRWNPTILAHPVENGGSRKKTAPFRNAFDWLGSENTRSKTAHFIIRNCNRSRDS
ncbi:MAG: hypothetical protein JO270_07225 [Acidobacteriaceae bacterium]|nr:hypothetical protein [Acidobacteriaceae bacterium]